MPVFRCYIHVHTYNYIPMVNICCRVTAKLRYYPKDYVQEFTAQAMGFLLRTRTAPFEQLEKGMTTPYYIYVCVCMYIYTYLYIYIYIQI